MINNNNELGWNLEISYAQLPEKFYATLELNPVKSPELVYFNEELAKNLGLDSEKLNSEAAVEVFAGNRMPKGSIPLAQAYGGHQFGHFNMLGDGRALLVGEQLTSSGECLDIQLKGSGRTPFSRGGDGRAALGPMLREYIISEAMYGLGIPTTRSLAVVSTGESIIRETELPGAILTRVAASHIRVGTFQYAARWGTIDDLQALADYTIKRHFPEIEEKEDRYLLLLREVINRQAALIAKWQLVGFIHGVMNTDNMTISGETIDYGPCAFMNSYDPATVFSSIDRQGRYAYGNQPPIGGWNLTRFAESLLPLLHEDQDEAVDLAQAEISKYMDLYNDYWLQGMRAKLGLFNEEKEDSSLIKELLEMMEQYSADFTNTFKALTLRQYNGSNLFNTTAFSDWSRKWEERLEKQQKTSEASQELMRNNNPAVIPRNHRVEEALAAAVEDGDYDVMKRLLNALSNPFEYAAEQEEYASLPPKSAKPYRTFCGT
ncbi:protein adenylyltransferase SelO [Aquibacillus kalidii]|uniref:protein adenylyltransferase SelO n=1 Tax=Aquibacillus kalidii TaxID=2762597 RepID=UPI001F216C73|nr:YdiU family protein [Aquibacillus kalidii]